MLEEIQRRIIKPLWGCLTKVGQPPERTELLIQPLLRKQSHQDTLSMGQRLRPLFIVLADLEAASLPLRGMLRAQRPAVWFLQRGFNCPFAMDFACSFLPIWPSNNCKRREVSGSRSWTRCTLPYAVDPRPPAEKEKAELFTTAESITTRFQSSRFFVLFLCLNFP